MLADALNLLDDDSDFDDDEEDLVDEWFLDPTSDEAILMKALAYCKTLSSIGQRYATDLPMRVLAVATGFTGTSSRSCVSVARAHSETACRIAQRRHTHATRPRRSSPACCLALAPLARRAERSSDSPSPPRARSNPFSRTAAHRSPVLSLPERRRRPRRARPARPDPAAPHRVSPSRERDPHARRARDGARALVRRLAPLWPVESRRLARAEPAARARTRALRVAVDAPARVFC